MQRYRATLLAAVLLFLFADPPARCGEEIPQAYKEARKLISQERWEESAIILSDFVQEHPQNPYADDAYFWMAYSFQWMEGKKEKAYETYQKLISTFPSSKWVDDAQSQMDLLAKQLEVWISDRHQQIKAGETAIIQMEIRNTGRLAIQQVRAIVHLPPRWHLEIKPSLLEEMAPGEREPVHIAVRPPEDVAAGQFDIPVEARGKVGSEKVESAEKKVRIWVRARRNILGNTQMLARGLVALPLGLVLLSLIMVHIAIAVTVYRDARELSSPAMGFRPWLWTLVSLYAPVLGMLCYWLMNRSTLSRE